MDHFTSRTACDAIADRAVRAVRRKELEPIPELQAALDDACDRLMRLGKLSRPAFRETWANLCAAMRAVPTVIDLRIDDLRTSKASANARARLCCVMAVPALGRSIEFATWHLAMTRHELACRMELTNVVVTGHVLSRFMQHRRQEPAAFLASATRSLQAAKLIVPATRLAAGGRTALAYGPDLLLGESYRLDGQEHDRHPPIDLRIDKNGMADCTTRTAEIPEGFVADMLEIRTFVGADATNLTNAAVHRMLAEWQDRHADGVRAEFETLPPGSDPPHGPAEEARLLACRRAAREAAEALVQSPLWTRFTTRAFGDGD